MSYFLKQTKNKKGIYLQIYETHYNPDKKYSSQKSYKAIGYIHELKKQGIKNPIDYYKKEVDDLNAIQKLEKEQENSRQISEVRPIKSLGYFPFRAINNMLGVQKDINYFDLATGFKYPIWDLFSSLLYARIITPYSKYKTYYDVMPKLYCKTNFSLNQLYEGLRYLGNQYEKIIEIYNNKINKVWGRNTNNTYFDCTNFYFEIDQEDGFRMDGPSKENKKSPIIGMGLLLDVDCIPLGMKLFPGNESEKPILREVINSIKEQNGIKGKVVRVADKGLNCAQNILDATKNEDGYIFSKSIKQLSRAEQIVALKGDDWENHYNKQGELKYKSKSFIDYFDYKVKGKDGKFITFEKKEKRLITFNPRLQRKQIREINKQIEKAQRLRLSEAKKNEFGYCAKYVNFESVDDNGCTTEESVIPTLNHKTIDRDKKLAGYNMIVTSETNLSDYEIYNTYHNLWRIEESFKVMKSQLEARPVYLQNEESIHGHFLICYISVLLLRILQIKIMNDKFSSESIMSFVRDFNIVIVSQKVV